MVRHPPALSAPPAPRPGRTGHAVPAGGGRPRHLPSPLRPLLPRVPAPRGRRRAALGGGERGGPLGACGRPAPVRHLLSDRRSGQRLQRPAPRLLLWRRPPAAPPGARAVVSRDRRGPPSGSRRAHQERGGTARALGPPGGGPRPRPEPPPAGSGPRRRRPGRARARAPPLLALGNPQPVRRKLWGAPDPREPLAGDRRAPAAPPAEDRLADGEPRPLDALLVRGPPGPRRGMAGIAAAGGRAAGVGGPGSSGDRLDRLHGQPGPGGAGADDLEPVPAPGAAPRARPLLLRAGRSSSSGSSAAAGPGRTRQISVSQSR